ncbi:methyltransferase domain-containing protein [Candidatus Thorarchaeota archaeon]|nr:MAG: methyltransferase domain-containing protein [Candidatus Thorarchaeota archaeon]
MEESGCEDAILWRRKLDIVDLNGVPDSSFDAVVAYGGLLGYVFDLAGEALAELLRVTRPDGYILLSVMSSLGTWRFHTESVLNEIQELGLPRFQKLFEDGDVTGKLAAKGTHHCHVVRWSELRSLVEEHNCKIVAVSACSFLANNKYIQERLKQTMQNPEVWNAFLRWELEFSREPGAIDASTHMIVVLRNGV